MNWTKNAAHCACTLAACTLLFLAVGCGDKAKDQLTANSTGKDSTKAQDAAEAKIQAALAELSPEDRKFAEAQEWCVSTGQRLGSMKKPIKLMIQNQPVFLCCASCEQDARADEADTLAKVAELKKKKQAAMSSK